MALGFLSVFEYRLMLERQNPSCTKAELDKFKRSKTYQAGAKLFLQLCGADPETCSISLVTNVLRVCLVHLAL